MWTNRSDDPNKPEYICKRGCSRIEGGHPYMHGSYAGSTYSPDLANAMLTCRLADANIRAGARNKHEPGISLSDAYEQHCKLRMAKKYGWEGQYAVPLITPMPHVTNEQFGVDYKPSQTDLTAAQREQALGRATASEELSHTEEQMLMDSGAITTWLSGAPH